MISKTMRKGIIALIGIILALVFIIIGLIGPWYGLTMNTMGTENKVALSLFSSTSTYGSNTITISHTDARKTAEASGQDTSMFDIFNITLFLMIFTLIFAILMLVFIIGYIFNFGKQGVLKNLTLVFGIFSFVLAFAAVFYFMVAVPGKLSSLSSLTDVGFWYSTSISGNTFSIGPGFAWYLMLIASIITLICLIIVFIDKQEVPITQNPAPP